jgi:hypothetical protein
MNPDGLVFVRRRWWLVDGGWEPVSAVSYGTMTRDAKQRIESLESIRTKLIATQDVPLWTSVSAGPDCGGDRSRDSGRPRQRCQQGGEVSREEDASLSVWAPSTPTAPPQALF